MANYRSIHNKLWTDPKVESLSIDARYLFLYLITNEHRNESALYSLTVRTMAHETGLPEKRVRTALAELVASRRAAYDESECVVWVVNAARHTPMNDNCIKSVAKDLEFCSSVVLREMFCRHYANHLSLQEVTKRFANDKVMVPDGFIEPIIHGTGYKVQGTGKGRTAKTEFVPPSELEVVAYFESNGFPESLAKRAFKGYAEADWHDSKGNKVRNWKQKMVNVWFKDENRKKPPRGDSRGLSPLMMSERDMEARRRESHA